MKYMAHVIPATGSPLKRGDIAAVVTAAIRLLDTSPSYTVTIRPSDNETKPRHSIHLRKTGDTILVSAHPGQTYTARPAEIERDIDEITTVLRNLGTPATKETST